MFHFLFIVGNGLKNQIDTVLFVAVHIPETADVGTGSACRFIRISFLSWGDSPYKIGQEVDGFLQHALAVLQRQDEALPRGLEGGDGPGNGVHPLIGDILQDPACLLQLLAKGLGAVRSGEESVEGGDGTFVCQFQRRRKVDAPFVELLQPVDQFWERTDGLAERLCQFPVCIGEVQDDVAGCRGGGRCVETGVCEGSQEGRGIFDAESERPRDRPDDGHGGLQVGEIQGALVGRECQRGHDVIGLARPQSEHPERCSGESGRLRKLRSDGRGEVQHRTRHPEDIPLRESELREFGLEAGDIGCRVPCRPSQFFRLVGQVENQPDILSEDGGQVDVCLLKVLDCIECP